MTKVRISFDYVPDEPDGEDSTGMSEPEYVRLQDALIDLGADNVEINKAP